ncbi:protein FAR1-RELATED SEQUENCE 5-like [Malus domestica]|uniref:protein FAR1-RELATED SEQUENCE 5-like n=1 Tax=Malus domestica TaxID=3750 RepID=UPI00397578FD
MEHQDDEFHTPSSSDAKEAVDCIHLDSDSDSETFEVLDQNEEKGEFTSKVGDISLGMTFDNEDDAYNYYNAYARRVGFSVRKNIENKDRSGLQPSQIFSYFTTEAGGSQKLNFIQSDCNNLIMRKRIGILKKGDSEYLLEYFKKKQYEDKCGLPDGETTDACEWLFKIFLQAMDGKTPGTIFTDQAQSIAAAISEDFKRCIYDPETIEEFESNWNKLLDDYELRGNDWLEGIYLVREKWAQVYGRDHFCASMTTTQRIESLNKFLKKYFGRNLLVQEFVIQYDKTIADRKENERQAKNATKQKWRSLYSDWNVEIEASKQYTNLSSIPSNYYLKRLSKDAKCGIGFDSYGELAVSNLDSSSLVHYSELSNIAQRIIVKAFKKSNSNAYEMNGPSTRYAQTQV